MGRFGSPFGWRRGCSGPPLPTMPVCGVPEPRRPGPACPLAEAGLAETGGLREPVCRRWATVLRGAQKAGNPGRTHKEAVEGVWRGSEHPQRLSSSPAPPVTPRGSGAWRGRSPALSSPTPLRRAAICPGRSHSPRRSWAGAVTAALAVSGVLRK